MSIVFATPVLADPMEFSGEAKRAAVELGSIKGAALRYELLTEREGSSNSFKEISTEVVDA